ncbi:uncharacterized protein LOC141651760 [Silene latifolia]|uniref:uncharacterized protein LOC141651760 n=1 Tax=Silene latifolia TaxID=37657 RepID=UPI003D77C2E0
MALDVSKRTTLKRLGKALGYAPPTCHRWVKRGLIKSHTNAIHPDLTEDNKYIRLHFVMGKLVFDRLLRYYIGSNEAAPYRSCKSKRYITKVMFLADVSRPIYKDNGEGLFDGKLGSHLLTKNQPKEEKWTVSASKEISIQQDNDKPHINEKDKDFLEAATSDGFNIKLTQQPANSPDLNILDLGFFRSIQSLQDEYPANTAEELVKNVIEAYEAETARTLDNVWLSLQACMKEIMQKRGHNNYPLQHLAKAAQRRQGHFLEI